MAWVLNVSVKNEVYDEKQKAEDQEKNKKEKYLSKYIDKVIDILIDNLSCRENHNNGHYTYRSKNGVEAKFSYETSVYGYQPRYQIEIIHSIKPSENGTYSYKCPFSYYHGEVNKNFKDTFVTEVNRKDLKVLTAMIVDISLNEDLSNRVLKKINKLVSKINTFTE